MDSVNISYLAILLAATSNFLVGGLWYSVIFANKWQKLSGVTDKQLQTGTTKIFALSYVLSLIMAANLAAFIGSEGLVFGMFAGLAASLGWVAMAFGINYLFERKPLCLYFINASYFVTSFSIMGLIIGAFQ